MKRMLLLTIAALSLSGCNLPDLDLDGASYTPRNSTAAAAAPQDQKPASRYDTGQAAENTGDYSNYR